MGHTQKGKFGNLRVNHTITSLLTQGSDPQIVSGSMDKMVRLWDIRNGRAAATLTNHRKGVRALAQHSVEFGFASAGADDIKKWQFPEGTFRSNFSGHRTIVHTLSMNRDNVLVSGDDAGGLRFWDWKTGHCFQSTKSRVQPGSLQSEGSILASAFDVTGSRLITCEADKTVKIWKEVADATPETHPVEGWNLPSRKRRRF